MDTPFPAYTGSDAYTFACYAHADAALVYADLQRLADLGVNIWYDEGITPGAEWSQALADAISAAAGLVFFVSPASVASRHCLNEVQFALARNKPILAIHLQPCDLPGGLELALGASQAILRHTLADVAYTRKLAAYFSEPASAGTRQPALVQAHGHAHAHAQDTPPRIAVLPFTDVTGAGADMGIGYGVAEELLDLLARTPDLQVVSSALTFGTGAMAQDLVARAQQLNCQFIVHGSVRRAGDQFRLLARLTGGANGQLVWSGAHDGSLSDIFAAQRQIAQQIAESLDVAVRYWAQGAQEVANPQALEHFLHGQRLLREASGLTALRQAQGYFQQAVQVQPAFLPGLLGLCRAALAIFARTEDPQEFAVAERHALALIAQDNQTIEARVVLGALYNHKGRYQQAEQVLLEATRRSPYFEPACAELARTCIGLGRNEDAEAALTRCISLEPRSWKACLAYGNFLARLRRFDAAIAQYARITELAPREFVGYASLAVAHLEAGNLEQTLQYSAQALAIGDDSRIHFNVGLAHQGLGHHDEAIAAFKRALALNPKNYRAWMLIAEISQQDGAAEQVLAAARQALAVADELVGINPADGYILSHTASLLQVLGDNEGALARVRRAVALEPHNPKVRFNAGTVYQGAGDHAGAMAEMCLALELGYPPTMFRTSTGAEPFLDEPAVLALLGDAD